MISLQHVSQRIFVVTMVIAYRIINDVMASIIVKMVQTKSDVKVGTFGILLLQILLSLNQSTVI